MLEFKQIDQLSLRKKVRDFARRELTPDVTERYLDGSKYPDDLRRKAAKEFLPLMDNMFSKVTVIEEMCRINPGLGLTIAEQPLFGSDLLDLYGKEWQKNDILKKIRDGQYICGLGVTEAGGGSDVASIRTKAERRDGHFVLNGSKMFITNGSVADYILVLARTSFNEEKKHRGMTLFLVDTKSEGFRTTKLLGKMGINASVTSELTFEDVIVPDENIVGQEGMGFYHVMDFFNRSRINVASMALGIAEGSLDLLKKHFMQGKNDAVDAFASEEYLFELSDIVTKVHMAKNLTYEAASMIAENMPDPMITSMAKKVSSETAVSVSRRVARLIGVSGIMDEAERFVRDAKVMDIWEGTTEMENLIIARTLLKRGDSSEY